MEVDEEKQGTLVKDALKADSVAVLLSQALQAQDRALLERCAQLALHAVPRERPLLSLCLCMLCNMTSRPKQTCLCHSVSKGGGCLLLRVHAALSQVSLPGLSSSQVPGGEE